MEVPNNEENMSKCVCTSCPSYIQGDTGFFCATDKSKMDVVKRGCSCADCALWGQYELSGGYFCTEGKAT